MKTNLTAGLAALALAAGLTGCSGPSNPSTKAAASSTPTAVSAAPASSEATAAAPPSKLDQLFQLDTLNATRQFIETITGPAKYDDSASGETTYIVEGCRVVVVYGGNQVSAIGMDKLSKSCTFAVSKFYPGTHYPDAYRLTIEDLHPATVEFGCIGTSCGNSLDPYMDAAHVGSHSEDWVDIYGEAAYPYSPADKGVALNKFFSWVEAKPPFDPFKGPFWQCSPLNDRGYLGHARSVHFSKVLVGSGLSDRVACLKPLATPEPLFAPPSGE